jgi:hypothetical protein
MISFAWTPKANCYDAGVRDAGCPSILWFWVMAGAGLLLAAAGKKRQEAPKS